MPTTIEIDEDEFRALLNERDHLRRQVEDLQHAGTALVELRRQGDISYCVGAFHQAHGYPVRRVPTIDIPRAEMTLRASLMSEEYFETMHGFYATIPRLEEAYELVKWVVANVSPAPDLVQIADGLCDQDYINDGTRHYFGIPRVPILKEVQRANMEKMGGPVRADGKLLKPPGWRAPDIAGVLRAHGWRG